ncbi:SURF1 family protein [uncultured Tessaracoccus sp.]|uniref:SURF1 family protein n=1 Tax=uncultured Tessaracoccus sp. TaxID=905023 RepID=UPI0025CED7D0|nr:SURF1 family protein [uncultured Tessaracoccus sp.]
MSLRTKQFVAVASGLAVAAVMVVLGLWQMSRFQLSVEDVATERAAQPPVALAPAVHANGTVDDVYGRRVSAAGEYLPEHQVVTGTTEARVVTAMRLDDGRHVAVVRGSVAEGDQPAAPPSGRQEIVGVFLASDHEQDRPSGSVRLQRLAQTWPAPLVGGYVTLDEEQSAQQGLAPAKVELPEQHGTAMHQGYALQWWVFAVAAIAFGIFLARQFRVAEERRVRVRMQRAARAEAGREVAAQEDRPG